MQGRSQRDHPTTIRIDRPIPFSNDAIQATLGSVSNSHWLRRAAQASIPTPSAPIVREFRTTGTGSSAPTSPWGSPSGVLGPLRLAFDHRSTPELQTLLGESNGQTTKSKPKSDPCACCELDCKTGGRGLVLVCWLIFAIFTVSATILMVVVILRVDDILERIDVAPITNHLHKVLNEAHEAASTSKMFGTDLRTTLSQVAPAIMGAVNATTGMVKRMDDFTQHPALTISAAMPGVNAGIG